MTNINLKTIDISGQKSSQQEFQINDHDESHYISEANISYVVRWQLARRRSGSAKVKTMSEIAGTTAKPWKQKGTGRARQGSRRSVQFVGGRTCHGPVPRSFDFSIPKKIVLKALSDVITSKIQNNKLVLFNNFSTRIKTSALKNILAGNGVDNALIVYDGSINQGKFVNEATRNNKSLKSIDSKAINVYDIIKFDNLIIDEKIFQSIIVNDILL
jgi:large subunit ribosomal protein L4